MLRVAGAGLLIAAGAIHLDLYLTGYRTIPVIGWLFLLQVIAAFGLGLAVLAGISLKYSPEDVYAGTMWGALQALDAGITTIADWAHNDQSPAHADADLRGLRDSGIRGYFLYGGPGPATADPDPPHPADARRMRD
jgi:5-methylthioadenosine/S-adenosylhomocysteine deaminase